MTNDIVEIAWAAGLFEGEGCIGVNRPSQPRSVSLQLVSTDKDVIERFGYIVGVGNLTGKYQNPSPNHKRQWVWSIGKRREVEQVLHAFRPFFGTRRRAKCDEALTVIGIYTKGYPARYLSS